MVIYCWSVNSPRRVQVETNPDRSTFESLKTLLYPAKERKSIQLTAALSTRGGHSVTQSATMTRLLKHGADPNIQCARHCTHSTSPARSESELDVQTFLSANTTPAPRDQDLPTPFSGAALTNNLPASSYSASTAGPVESAFPPYCVSPPGVHIQTL